MQWRLGTVEHGSSGSLLLANYDRHDYFVSVVSSSSSGEDLDQDSPWGPVRDAGLRTAFNRFDTVCDLIEEQLENEPRGSTTPQLVKATVTLVQDESGAWWRGTTEATEGMTILTPAGTRYRLSFVNGAWVATEVTG